MPSKRLARGLDLSRRVSSDLLKLVRLTRDLPAFVRAPVTADAVSRKLQHDLLMRPRRFLALVRRGVYAQPSSPYLQLLRAAGCELADLESLVENEGLEGALERLAAAGVYVTYDELKGRREAVRGSQRFHFAETDFDTPLLRSHLDLPTGGTRGVPSRVGRSLPLVSDLAGAVLLALDAHGVTHARHAVWHPTPFNWLLIIAKLGEPAAAWFYPLQPLPTTVRLGSQYLAALNRVFPSPFPLPRYCDLQDPSAVLTWLAAQAKEGRPVCLWTFSSSAVRIAAAALDAGITLRGVVFLVQGEPFTEARRRIVEEAGAHAIVRYGTMEVPTVALSCPDGRAADDVHLFQDRYAVLQRTRAIGDADLSVDALLFTALNPTAPKTLLNVETGDNALVEQRDCDCGLGAIGLRTHLAHIQSYEKLTGEGMTFARTNLTHIIEETLPARFGGRSLDYQLVEAETVGGVTRLLLLVSPRVGPVDEAAVRSALLEELARDGAVEQYMASFWRRAGTVDVRRQTPMSTRAGKVLPFHLVKAEQLEAARSLERWP